MGYLLQSGDSYTPAPSKEALLEGLPPGVFTVEESMSGLYFKRAEELPTVSRVYGNLARYRDRILSTFKDRASNTGVLLAGEKGSGKSLLGRLISVGAMEEGMATVMVNRAIHGAALGPLLGHLSTPAVIFFDEFEKTYDEHQESILSLLDGTAPGKHLFVFTVNDTYRVDRHMRNRPGRLYYNIEFSGLDADFIREYCQDRLEDASHGEAIVTMSTLFEQFNFDMLKALVEEMNRYGETPQEAVKMLNIAPPQESNRRYSVTIFDPEGKEREPLYGEFRGNPLFMREYELGVELNPTGGSGKRSEEPLAQWERELLGEDEDNDRYYFTVSASDLVNYNSQSQTFEFVVDGWRVLMGAKPDMASPNWAIL